MEELKEVDKLLNYLFEKRVRFDIELENILQEYRTILDKYDKYNEMKKSS